MTITELLAPIEARLAAATPWPWNWYQLGGSAHLLSEATPARRAIITASSHNRTPYIAECDSDGLLYRVDVDRAVSPSLDLIAHAPTDLAKLIAALNRSDKALDNIYFNGNFTSENAKTAEKARADIAAILQKENG